MLRRIKYHCLLILLLIQGGLLYAQVQPDQFVNDIPSAAETELAQSSYTLFTVRNIIITGNKKTKPAIILREIPFKQGDRFSLQEIV
ncbi:MAG: POTRA domain-containing protein, partial [Parafilimonas sp.]